VAALGPQWKNDRDVIEIRRLVEAGDCRRAQMRFLNRWPMDHAKTEIDETDGTLVRVLESPETVQERIRNELKNG
jgi:hypothetical protein